MATNTSRRTGLRRLHIMRRKNSTRGFTLLEVLIAVLIVGIIATAALPMLGSYTEKAREARQTANTLVKMQAQERYSFDHHAPLGYVWEDSSSSFIPFELASLTGPSKQLLTPTDINGNVMGDAVSATPGPFTCGPYLAQLPADPASLLLAEVATPPVPPFAPKVEAFGTKVNVLTGDVTHTLTVYKLLQGAGWKGKANEQALDNQFTQKYVIEDLTSKVSVGFPPADIKLILGAYAQLLNQLYTHGQDPGYRWDTNTLRPVRSPNQSANWVPGSDPDDALDALANTLLETGKSLGAFDAAVDGVSGYIPNVVCVAEDLTAKKILSGELKRGGEPIDFGKAVTAQGRLNKWMADVDRRVEEFFVREGRTVSKADQGVVVNVLRNAVTIGMAGTIASSRGGGAVQQKAASAPVSSTLWRAFEEEKVPFSEFAYTLPSVASEFDSQELYDQADQSFSRNFSLSTANEVAGIFEITRPERMSDLDWRYYAASEFGRGARNQIAKEVGADATYLTETGITAAGAMGNLADSALGNMFRVTSPCATGKSYQLNWGEADFLAADPTDLPKRIQDNLDGLTTRIKWQQEVLAPAVEGITANLKTAADSLVAFKSLYIPDYEVTRGDDRGQTHDKHDVVVVVPGEIGERHQIPLMGDRASLSRDFTGKYGIRFHRRGKPITQVIMRQMEYAVALDKAITKAALK